ncbi:hypothetical protein BaRGS_00036984, partial [Batillaria attramentaria]
PFHPKSPPPPPLFHPTTRLSVVVCQLYEEEGEESNLSPSLVVCCSTLLPQVVSSHLASSHETWREVLDISKPGMDLYLLNVLHQLLIPHRVSRAERDSRLGTLNAYKSTKPLKTIDIAAQREIHKLRKGHCGRSVKIPVT